MAYKYSLFVCCRLSLLFFEAKWTTSGPLEGNIRHRLTIS